MNLKIEIKKRFKEDIHTYEAIGAEIKRHRLAMSKTLSSIADKNCSISYLCKIERNQVVPSPKYLAEICEKVNITEENIKYLLSSKDLLVEAVKLFFFRDVNGKNKYEESLAGLENYRTEIIRLIFNLTERNLDEALRSISKVWNLMSSLSDLDLMIFAGFYGVYKYLTKEYLEASEYLKLALEFRVEVNYFRPIMLRYLFLISFKIGSKSIYKYYKCLEEEKLKYGENLNLDDVYYHLALYYINSRDENGYNETRLKIASKSLNYNLDILYKLSVKAEVGEVNLFELDDYTKIIYLLKTSNDNLIEIIDNTNLDSDYKVHFKYLYYKKHDLEEAYNFLLNIAFPYAIVKDIYSKARYYLNEMVNSIFRPNKYKKFFEMYVELDRVLELVNNI